MYLHTRCVRAANDNISSRVFNLNTFIVLHFFIHESRREDTQHGAASHSPRRVNVKARSSTTEQRLVRSAQSARTARQSLHLSGRDIRVTNMDLTLRTPFVPPLDGAPAIVYHVENPFVFYLHIFLS